MSEEELVPLDEAIVSLGFTREELNRCVYETGEENYPVDLTTPHSEVEYGPDPYLKEITGYTVPVWMCRNCRAGRKMQI